MLRADEQALSHQPTAARPAAAYPGVLVTAAHRTALAV